MSPRFALALAAVALIVGGGYLIACWLFPFAACYRCEGAGKKRSASGRAWRPCRRCKGTGSRLRFGRKISQYMTRTFGDAK